MKRHKISAELFKKAVVFHKKHGFWNPAMTEVRFSCGMEPERAGAITTNWRKVSCRRCLSKRPKSAANRDSGLSEGEATRPKTEGGGVSNRIAVEYSWRLIARDEKRKLLATHVHPQVFCIERTVTEIREAKHPDRLERQLADIEEASAAIRVFLEEFK